MKSILIFNDISGLGNCSMCANLPIFTALGHCCMPIVTATFSCQTGFEKFTCQPNAELPQCVADIRGNRLPDAVYVGFCVNADILEQVTQAVRDLSGSFVFVDPIMGDNGALYSVFDKPYVQKMKNIVRFAQCVTPNLTEACLLADVDFDELISHRDEPAFLAVCGKAFENFLAKTGAGSAVITGVVCGKLIGNIVLERKQSPRFVTNDRVPINFSGTGDLFSSVICGELLNGCNLLRATEIAADFVYKAAAFTDCSDRRFGVEFAKVLRLLNIV